MDNDKTTLGDWAVMLATFVIWGWLIGEPQEESKAALQACRAKQKNTEAYVKGFTWALNQQPVVVDDQLLTCRRKEIKS